MTTSRSDRERILDSITEELTNRGLFAKNNAAYGWVYYYPNNILLCEFYVSDGILKDLEGEYDGWEVANLSDPNFHEKVIKYVSTVLRNRIDHYQKLADMGKKLYSNL